LWTEPFAAELAGSPTGELCRYSIRFGSRRTLLKLDAVRKQMRAGKFFDPPTPIRDTGWAFVFRMGERVR
jgi:hypothetical protein